jgi:hypothetical protein
LPPTEPSVVLANALTAVQIESPALVDIATRLPSDLGRGFSVHTDGEFLSLWCETRVTDVVASLATIGTAVPWAPSAPGSVRFGQRAGIPSVSAEALWETREPAEAFRTTLTSSGFADVAATAHKRVLGRLHADPSTRRGCRQTRIGGAAGAVFAVDHVISSSEAASTAQQIALAARTFGVSQRQMTWFLSAMPALCPRPLNLVTATFGLSPRGLLPWMDVRIADVPMRSVLQLYRQFSLLEEGAAARLGALTAVMGREDEQVDGLHIVLTNEEPPRFAVDLAYAG